MVCSNLILTCSWPSFPSREGTVPPSPSREGTETVLRSEADGGESRQEQVVVGASAEDAEAAERSPLQLPESLIPEQVSIDVIRKEQRNDPFSIDLLSQLEKLPDGEVVTQADGRTKSGRALALEQVCCARWSVVPSHRSIRPEGRI